MQSSRKISSFYAKRQRELPKPLGLFPPTLQHVTICPVRLGTQTGLKVLLYVAMRRQDVTKAQLARRMGIARQHANLLLDLNHTSRLDALDAAFLALGQEVAVELRDRAA